MVLTTKNGLVSLTGKTDEVENYQPVESNTNFRMILWDSLTIQTQTQIKDAVRNCLPLLEAVVAEFPKSAAEYWAVRLVEGRGNFLPIPDETRAYGSGNDSYFSAMWGTEREGLVIDWPKPEIGFRVHAVEFKTKLHEMFAFFNADGGVIKEYDPHRETLVRCRFWGCYCFDTRHTYTTLQCPPYHD